MKLIKINTNHYVIVDDSEIKEGDWYYWEITKTIQIAKLDSLNRLPKNSDGSKKITHSTQPLYKNDFWAIQELKLSEVKELIGEVDVEKKAEEKIPNLSYKNYVKIGFIGGYNQALEDNKEKKWTDEDVIRIVEKSRETGLTAEYLILLKQPITEWEVEFDEQGKLRLV